MTARNAWDGHRWALRYARRFAERNMISQVRVVRAADAEFDGSDGVVTADDGVAVYEGRARVYTVSGPVTYSLGDENQYFSGSYVSIPVIGQDGEPTAPRVDDLVVVTASDDPLMVGRTFRVMDVEAGGQWLAARRMQVVGVQWHRSWEGLRSGRTRSEDHLPPKEWQV